jgi:hypothetical protein
MIFARKKQISDASNNPPTGKGGYFACVLRLPPCFLSEQVIFRGEMSEVGVNGFNCLRKPLGERFRFGIGAFAQ